MRDEDLQQRARSLNGFSTIAKDSESGTQGLPTGFLPVDLAAALHKDDSRLQLYDPARR